MKNKKFCGYLENDGLSEEKVNDAEVEISDEELELINGYARKKLGKDEVYVFSVVLCDNDIDRDGERFTVESLFELEKLFVGKTGIIDHNPSANNQTARIISCCVEAIEGKTTQTGDDYFRLTARAYMPKSEKNKDIILALDSGIMKEVSVSCAVENIVCSICGEDICNCKHIKGELYGAKICCGEMTNPYDAYEWSFVAVPAQKNAGVTKSYTDNWRKVKMEDVLKKIEKKQGFSLTDKECEKLGEYIDELRKSAKDGVYYRDSLTSDVLRLSAYVQPDISRDTMEELAKSMSVAQLKEFKTAFEKKKNAEFSVIPQLYKEKTNNQTESNGQFRI